MALSTHIIETTAETTARRAGRARAAESLAALPAGTIAAIFDNRVDAAGSAVQLSVDAPDTKVWVASGRDAANRILAARRARSLIRRFAGALSDDDAFVNSIVAEAGAGHAVLLAQSSRKAPISGAARVIEFGRWTTREVSRLTPAT